MKNDKFIVNYVKTAIEMAKFVEEKDTLYNHALFNMMDEYGMNYALSKITEKLFRLKQLKKLGKEDHSESFLDSLKDLWGYAFLTILYLEQVQNQEEPNEEIEEDIDFAYKYDDIQEEIEDNQDDEADDELSTYFYNLIEDCKRRIREIDNNVNLLIKEINENQKDDIEKNMLHQSNISQEENEDEERYSFTDDEYKKCKELPEDDETCDCCPLEISSKCLQEKIDNEIQSYLDDNEEGCCVDDENSEPLCDMNYTKNTDDTKYILGIHPWEVENTIREINDRYKTASENIDLKTLRKNMDKLEIRTLHLPSGLVLRPVSSNPTLLKRIPTDNETNKEVSNLNEFICKKIDEIIRNNFGK